MAETFQVTARKWRPMRFDDVVGQDHVTRTLKNAIREGRLAHAYLFTGQRGCGKTTVARVLAKAINCPNAAQNDYEPCNACEICIGITEGRSMDVSEIDGASNNGVDDVRMMRENVKYPPLQGAYKVIIIDEVHMLSTSAFNALLKTLEEPPKYLVFVFATTEVQKVLPTILSRTQRYDFRRMQLDEIIGRLRMIADTDGITIEDDALLIIAKKADGSMRDGQSIFDQVVAYTGMTVDTDRVRDALNLIDLDFYFDISDAILAREPKRAFEISSQVVSRGYDVEEFFIGLLDHLRNILTVTITKSTSLVEVSKSHQERYSNIAQEFSEGDVIRIVRLVQNSLEKLRTAQQPRIVLEVALVEMMMMERAMELQELLSELRGLKANPGSGSLPASPRELQPAASRAAIEAPIAPSPSASSSRPAPKAAIAPTPSKFSAASTSSPKGGAKTERSPSGEASVESPQLDNDVISAKWSAFGEYIKNTSRALHSIFNDLEFCGHRRATIYIAVPSRSVREMLLGHKEEMNGCLREYFGPGISFEAGPKEEMHQKAGSPVVRNPEVVTNVTSQAKQVDRERSDLEIALMNQLGAQEV